MLKVKVRFTDSNEEMEMVFTDNNLALFGELLREIKAGRIEVISQEWSK
jgi:hypothetical protein